VFGMWLIHFGIARDGTNGVGYYFLGVILQISTIAGFMMISDGLKDHDERRRVSSRVTAGIVSGLRKELKAHNNVVRRLMAIANQNMAFEKLTSYRRSEGLEKYLDLAIEKLTVQAESRRVAVDIFEAMKNEPLESLGELPEIDGEDSLSLRDHLAAMMSPRRTFPRFWEGSGSIS